MHPFDEEAGLKMTLDELCFASLASETPIAMENRIFFAWRKMMTQGEGVMRDFVIT